MDKEMSWGWLILIFLFFVSFSGNGLFGGRADTVQAVNNTVGQRDLLDTMFSGFTGLGNQAVANTNNINSNINAIGNKIDYYAYEGLKDQLAQERSKNLVLENRVYSDAQFNVINSQFARTDAMIQALACELPKRPPVYAQSYSPYGFNIPQPCPCAVA